MKTLIVGIAFLLSGATAYSDTLKVAVSSDDKLLIYRLNDSGKFRGGFSAALNTLPTDIATLVNSRESVFENLISPLMQTTRLLEPSVLLASTLYSASVQITNNRDQAFDLLILDPTTKAIAFYLDYRANLLGAKQVGRNLLALTKNSARSPTMELSATDKKSSLKAGARVAGKVVGKILVVVTVAEYGYDVYQDGLVQGTKTFCYDNTVGIYNDLCEIGSNVADAAGSAWNACKCWWEED